MRVIILAGGLGTRISEETQNKPKPMVPINGKPILEHIFEIYMAHGFSDFIVALGYKGEVINSWLSRIDEPSQYRPIGFQRDFQLQLSNGLANISTVETGLNSLTGTRIKICIENSGDREFMATYGDGLGNVNLTELRQEFRVADKDVIVTAVHPPARFGYLKISGNSVIEFGEKKPSDAGWINGGFFILSREILRFFNSANESFENDILPRIAQEGKLGAFFHTGFWQPMDTLREKQILDQLGDQVCPPWLNFN